MSMTPNGVSLDGVFCTTVRRTTHFHNLKETEEVAHPFGIAHDDDTVGNGLFHTERRPVGVFCRRSNLGNQDGCAPERSEFLAESEQEITDELFRLDL